jgi:glycosyltransferase involved in cell wall biosynthesis
MGRSFWRPEDVTVMRDVVTTVLERNPQVDFVAAGDPKIHDQLGVPEDRRVTLPPFNFRTRGDMKNSKIVETTASMDIGLVPLAPNRFNEGKSCLKGMEYAACGIPCVATPTGPYREWVDSDNGLLAATPAEWVQSIEALLDRDTRVRMGGNARRKAKRHRYDKHWQKWADVYLGEVMQARQRQLVAA